MFSWGCTLKSFLIIIIFCYCWKHLRSFIIIGDKINYVFHYYFFTSMYDTILADLLSVGRGVLNELSGCSIL